VPDSRRLPFVALACVAVGVVVGWLLGGVGPRVEVAERDEAIADLERRLEEADTGGWRSPVPGLDRILRAPEEDERALRVLPPADDGVEVAGDEGGASDPAVAYGDGGVPRSQWRDRWEDRDPEDRLAAFRRAASLQRVRRVQSRAALVQQADLTGEEAREVDAALSEMNDALSGYGEELILLAMSDEPPAARDLLGITHDITGILHRAQLRLEGVVGSDRMGDVDPSALEIWNHVDLARLEPAARAAMQGADR